MPYCPECGYEYTPEHTRCPECDVPLQAEPPKEAPEAKWVVLKHVSLKGEGRIIHGLMVSNGIPAVVEDISFDMIPGTSEDLTRIRVMVREKDLEKAKELLDSSELEDNEPEDGPSED